MGEHPFYRLFRHISFPLEYELWRKMPRHPSFKHEYFNGKLHWTPRPKTCEVYLDLEQWHPPEAGESTLRSKREAVTERRLKEADWKVLPNIFCAASSQWPPLSQWDGAAPLRGARTIIEWARQGKDGPLIPEACRVALIKDGTARKRKTSIIGAAIVTLMRTERLISPPRTNSDYLAHLDWIFVHWLEQRRGIATVLLGAVVKELRALGHRILASTVLTANAGPMLWHWSSGFRLPRGGY